MVKCDTLTLASLLILLVEPGLCSCSCLLCALACPLPVLCWDLLASLKCCTEMVRQLALCMELHRLLFCDAPPPLLPKTASHQLLPSCSFVEIATVRYPLFTLSY